LSSPRVDSRQYGGESFCTASLFLRWVVPGGEASARPVRVPLLAGMRATALLLATLPKLRVSLTDSPAGERLRRHFRHRIWGILHSRLAQGVLVLPEDEGRYLRGRSRQAVRTNMHKAQAAGIACRSLKDVEERRAATQCLRPGMSEWGDDLFSLPGDAWRAAFAPSGEPVAFAQMTVDREWTLLQTFVSTDGASRYLLHTDLVETLVRAKARYLAVNAPMAPLLEPPLQYWQRLLGYQVANLSLSRTPLPAEEPELAADVDADGVLSAL
jgi:hypothetical protein